MNSVGIMQGRVFPERLDRLQVFPTSRWESELAEISILGFDCLELLYDRRLDCQRLCFDSEDGRLLWSRQAPHRTRPLARSMCVDYMASISALKSWSRFARVLGSLIGEVNGTGIEILVIPFCDENEIGDQESLEIVLRKIQESALANRATENHLTLALEISLPASEILAAFSKFTPFEHKVCLDLGNLKGMALEPEAEILKLADRICHVHVKDRAVGGPNVLLGDGEVNFHRSFRALQKVGYTGSLVLETRYFTDPRAEALRNLRYVNAVLKAVAS